MARLFHDSGAYFASTPTARLRKWDAENIIPAGPNTTYSPFSGGYGYAVEYDVNYGGYPGGFGSLLQKNLGGNKQTTFPGMWMRPVTAAPWFPLWTWRDGVDTQIIVGFTPDGSIIVWKGLPTTGVQLDISASGVLNSTLHQFVSAKCKIDNAAGEVIVKVNNVEVVSFAGDTQATANAYATNIWCGGRGPTAGQNNCLMMFSEFRINDDSGAKNNSFPVPSRIVALRPNAAGDESDYALTGAATAHEALDDINSDDDTSYAESSTPGDIVLCNMETVVAFNAEIIALAVNTIEERDDAGARTARHKIRYGAGPTTTDGAAYTPAAAQYTNQQTIFEDDLTQSELDGIQTGFEVVT